MWSAIEQFQTGRDRERTLYVVHCASLGEYEMAQPVIASLKNQRPDIYIVVTFFSPSGYEKVGSSTPADLVTYLPFDSVAKVNQFYQALVPEKLILTSYEIWPNLVWLASRLDIGIYLIAARLEQENVKTAPIVRSLYASLYDKMSAIAFISEEDHARFTAAYGSPDHVQLSILGNPRYDRVLQRYRERQIDRHIPEAFGQGPTFLGGSIWSADNRIVLLALEELMQQHPSLKFILAPHEPTGSHLHRLIEWCVRNGYRHRLFTELSENDFLDRELQVLIIDTVGVLAELYRYADIAFIGGGFTGSVHNVMEPAVAGCVVFFGPDYHNSHEAEQLIARNGGAAVTETQELLEGVSRLLQNEGMRETMQNAAATMIEENAGATEKTVQLILSEECSH